MDGRFYFFLFLVQVVRVSQRRNKSFTDELYRLSGLKRSRMHLHRTKMFKERQIDLFGEW